MILQHYHGCSQLSLAPGVLVLFGALHREGVLDALYTSRPLSQREPSRESLGSSSAILSSFPGSSALEREIELVHTEYISRSGEPGNEATAILEYVEWEFPLLLALT